LLDRLRDPEAQPDLQDILLSLLHCDPEEAASVEAALVDRCEREEDTLLADALGEALGTMWATHGGPDDATLARLPDVARTAATATFETLVANRGPGERA
jgi:hypothetical protein